MTYKFLNYQQFKYYKSMFEPEYIYRKPLSNCKKNIRYVLAKKKTDVQMIKNQI
jgi:hypothetical protein